MKKEINPSPSNERKKSSILGKSLEAGASGILAWLVRGAMKWKANGGPLSPEKIRTVIDEVKSGKIE